MPVPLKGTASLAKGFYATCHGLLIYPTSGKGKPWQEKRMWGGGGFLQVLPDSRSRMAIEKLPVEGCAAQVMQLSVFVRR